MRRRAYPFILWLVAVGGCDRDDVGEASSCAFEGCPDDGDPCTELRCVGDTCIPFPAQVELACRMDSHCDSVFGACGPGRCRDVAGCGFQRCVLEETTACDDGDACTEDLCDPEVGACNHLPLGIDWPCETEADCEDGTLCTEDTCEPVSAGCARKHCPRRLLSPNCRTCASDADCGWRCQPAHCLDTGFCEDGPNDPHCDFRCAPFGTVVTGGSIDGTRGFAEPSAMTCDSGCTCTHELVLTFGGDQLALMTNDHEVFAECQVDACAQTAVCDKMRAGRGYQAGGGYVSYGPRDPAGATEDVLFERTLEWFCLATQSELMVGPWQGSLTIGDEVLRFAVEARVAASGSATEMVVAGTSDVPAQIVLLPSAKVRLDAAIETARGRFVGAVFSGPDAIAGEVVGEDGTRAVLSFALPE